jgi:hypothetical protein
MRPVGFLETSRYQQIAHRISATLAANEGPNAARNINTELDYLACPGVV